LGIECWPLLALVGFLKFSSVQANAQGSIIYGHFPPTIVPPPATSFPEDADGTRLFPGLTEPSTCPLYFNGRLVCTFSAAQNAFTVIPSSSLNAIIAAPVGQFGDGFAVPLIAGRQIGTDAQGYTWMSGDTALALTANADFGPIGLFTGSESAYLGLQFQQDGQTYYGWVRLGAPFAGENGGWLYDYAYETSPNTPIFAGDVPEPGTWALLLLGSAVFAARRTLTRLWGISEVKPNHSRGLTMPIALVHGVAWSVPAWSLMRELSMTVRCRPN